MMALMKGFLSSEKVDSTGAGGGSGSFAVPKKAGVSSVFWRGLYAPGRVEISGCRFVIEEASSHVEVASIGDCAVWVSPTDVRLVRRW
jgi:hypothetical protein